jgi:hypothetical protein
MEEAVEAVFAHPRFNHFIVDVRMRLRTKLMREKELRMVALVVGVVQLLKWLLPMAHSPQLPSIASLAAEILIKAAVEIITVTFPLDCAKDTWQAAADLEVGVSEAVLGLRTTRDVVDLLVGMTDTMLISNSTAGSFWWQRQFRRIRCCEKVPAWQAGRCSRCRCGQV